MKENRKVGRQSFEKKMPSKEIAENLRPLYGRMIVVKIELPVIGMPPEYDHIVGKVTRISTDRYPCRITLDNKYTFPIDVNAPCPRIVVVAPFSEIKERIKSGRSEKRHHFLSKLHCVKALDGLEAAYLIYKATKRKTFSFRQFEYRPKIKYL